MAGEANPAIRAAVALTVTGAATAGVMLLLGERAYEWIKAAHVIAIISWMAGMLYLPRLFIYHCDAPKGSPQSETFKVMEQRLMRIIINPAMALSWAFGLWLVWKGGWITASWRWRWPCQGSTATSQRRCASSPRTAMTRHRVSGG